MLLQKSWMKKGRFLKLYEAVKGLMKCLKSHAIYLDEKCKYQKLHHLIDHPSATPNDSCHFKHIVKSSRYVQWPILAGFNKLSFFTSNFGNIQYDIFANCGKIRLIPDVGKFTIVHMLPNVDPTIMLPFFGNLLVYKFCSLWVIAKVRTTLKSNVGNLILPLMAIYEIKSNVTSKL